MSIHIVVKCGDQLPSGMPCRGALATRSAQVPGAVREAREAGWSIDAVELDRCPSCNNRAAAEAAANRYRSESCP